MKYKKPIIIWIVLTIFLVLFLFFIPKEIAYPKYKQLVWVYFIFVFGFLPYFVFKIVKLSNQNFSSNKIIGICALSILIVGPTSALFQNYRENKDFEEYGKVAEAIVVDKKKSKSDWLIICKYQVNNTEFMTYYHTDEKNIYRIGDTISLIYNENFPRMYKIIF